MSQQRITEDIGEITMSWRRDDLSAFAVAFYAARAAFSLCCSILSIWRKAAFAIDCDKKRASKGHVSPPPCTRVTDIVVSAFERRI